MIAALSGAFFRNGSPITCLMTAKVIVYPSHHTFTVETGETLLEAALRAGLTLDYGCSDGTCGKCKARVIAGEVKEIRFHDYILLEIEKQLGMTLLCCSTPVTDLEIEAREAMQGPDDIPSQEILTKLQKFERLSDDLVIVHLRTPRSQLLRFLPGQHLELTLDGLLPKDLPIASCPCDGRNLRFHVRREAGDPFSERVFHGLKRADRIEVKGPRGHFVLDETSARPLILIAYDTGFGPISSLIEDAINIELAQPMHLYWYVPRDGKHYMDNYCRAWVDALDEFAYTPLVQLTDAAVGAEPLAESRLSMPSLWSPGNPGEPVVTDYPELSNFDCYVVGPEGFTVPLKRRLLQHKLPHDRLFMDILG
jgi:CDP-4-dehydro-6-deoxyglucose reductase